MRTSVRYLAEIKCVESTSATIVKEDLKQKNKIASLLTLTVVQGHIYQRSRLLTTKLSKDRDCQISWDGQIATSEMLAGDRGHTEFAFPHQWDVRCSSIDTSYSVINVPLSYALPAQDIFKNVTRQNTGWGGDSESRCHEVSVALPAQDIFKNVTRQKDWVRRW